MTDDTTKVPFAEVVLHEDCQHREQLSEEAVEAYAEAYDEHGMDALPPIDVFDVEGVGLVVIDGFHRMSGAFRAGLHFVRVRTVGTGDLAQAAWEALKSNHGHGVRRSNEDKRKAVRAAVSNPIGQEQSSRAIAEQCGVSPDFVSRIRKRWEAEQQVSSDDTSKRKGRDGKQHPARRQVSSDDTSEENTAPPEGADGEGGAEEPSGQAAASDPQGTGDGEAEPPPPSGGADDKVPRYGVELQEYAAGLRRVNRDNAAQRNGPGQWGQAASKAHAKVKEAITTLEAAVPVPCPPCEGKGCSVCRRSGWLTAGEAEQVS